MGIITIFQKPTLKRVYGLLDRQHGAIEPVRGSARTCRATRFLGANVRIPRAAGQEHQEHEACEYGVLGWFHDH
jgi:hypothetical protein